MDEYLMSEQLSDFLDFLAATEEQLHMSTAACNECELQQRDLEHFLELGTVNAVQSAKVAKRIREVRKKRRIEKDNIELCTLFVEWMNTHKESINSLQQLLGKVRKTEKRLDNRAYAIRTDILKDIYPNSHLG